MLALDRGSVYISVRHGVCEACKASRAGLMVSGAADVAVLICVHCWADAVFQALPSISRDLSQWAAARGRGS